MFHRLGYWALLIALMLWAQGCAHVDVKRQNLIQQQLIGTWECKKGDLFISTYSTIHFTETQMFVETSFKFPKTSKFSDKYIANYNVLTAVSSKIGFEIIEDYNADGSRKLDKTPLSERHYEVEIIQISDNRLIMQSSRLGGRNADISVNIVCQKLRSE